MVCVIDERDRLGNYLDKHKPFTCQVNHVFKLMAGNDESAYWWAKEDIKPRIEWLTKEIEK